MEFCNYINPYNLLHMETEIKPNPNILTWVIQRAGYELRDLALKFSTVADWLEETKKPTLKQLEAFSRKVKVLKAAFNII